MNYIWIYELIKLINSIFDNLISMGKNLTIANKFNQCKTLQKNITII